MTKIYRSPHAAIVHQIACDLADVGVIDKKTLRDFDQSCLVIPKALSPEDIRALRDREGVSQAVFARHLNVSPGQVSKWECGDKKPGGPALKLLRLIERDGLQAIA